MFGRLEIRLGKKREEESREVEGKRS